MLFQSRQENNLLLKNNSDKYNILKDEEADFDQKTPKVLSSKEGSDDEEIKEDRPLQRVNFQILEDLVEESREESMRGDSNVQSHKKVYLDGTR